MQYMLVFAVIFAIFAAATANVNVDTKTFQKCRPGSGRVDSKCEECAAGKFSWKSECIDCPVGFFAPAKGSISCTVCPSAESAGATTCQCDAGSFKTDSKKSPCRKCRPGKYSDQTDVDKCTSCTVGKFQPTFGKNSCLTCPSAEKPGASSCSTPLKIPTCAAGKYFQAATTVRTNEEDMTEFAGTCENCDPGTYSKEGQNLFCKKCPPGTYSASDLTNCIKCPGADPVGTKGKYAASYGNSVCLDCDSNTTNAKAGAKSCVAGATAANICEAGTFCANSDGSSGTLTDGKCNGKCAYCPKGKYNSDAMQASCLSCDAGKTTKFVGSSDEVKCTNNEKVYCPKGEYFNKVLTKCSKCPINTYNDEVNKVGLQACNRCAALDNGKKPFTESPGATGSSECVAPSNDMSCAIGTQLFKFDGKEICIGCMAGTYRSDNEATCKKCPEGETSTPNSTECTDTPEEVCGPGYFKGGKKDKCIPCGLNTYSSTLGAISCTACPEGKVSPKYSFTIGMCKTTSGKKCPSGTYGEMIAGVCAECPRATYSRVNVETADDCKKCPWNMGGPSGSSSAMNCGKGGLSACPLGSETRNHSFSTSCKPCSAGKYGIFDDDGAAICEDCEVEGMTSRRGATDAKQCFVQTKPVDDSTANESINVVTKPSETYLSMNIPLIGINPDEFKATQEANAAAIEATLASIIKYEYPDAQLNFKSTTAVAINGDNFECPAGSTTCQGFELESLIDLKNNPNMVDALWAEVFEAAYITQGFSWACGFSWVSWIQGFGFKWAGFGFDWATFKPYMGFGMPMIQSRLRRKLQQSSRGTSNIRVDTVVMTDHEGTPKAVAEIVNSVVAGAINSGNFNTGLNNVAASLGADKLTTSAAVGYSSTDSSPDSNKPADADTDKDSGSNKGGAIAAAVISSLVFLVIIYFAKKKQDEKAATQAAAEAGTAGADAAATVNPVQATATA